LKNKGTSPSRGERRESHAKTSLYGDVMIGVGNREPRRPTMSAPLPRKNAAYDADRNEWRVTMD